MSAKTRKPYIYVERKRPIFSDLFADQPRRRRYLQYLRGEAWSEIFDHIFFHISRRLPVDAVSRFGGRFVRFIGPRHYPGALAIARDNLRELIPGQSPAELEARVMAHFDNIGRNLAEFSAIDRLHGQGRLTIENVELLSDVCASGPTILLGLHTSNWELIFAAIATKKILIAHVAAPLLTRSHLDMVVPVRTKLGSTHLPMGMKGARPALRVLENRGVLLVFGDEEHAGETMAPFFGRPPHLNGNLAIIARLARKTGARILVCHAERQPERPFHVIFGPEVVLPSVVTPGTELIDDVAALNAAIEPIVRAHCDSWVFLDRPFH